MVLDSACVVFGGVDQHQSRPSPPPSETYLKARSGWHRRVQALQQGRGYVPKGGHIKKYTAIEGTGGSVPGTGGGSCVGLIGTLVGSPPTLPTSSTYQPLEVATIASPASCCTIGCCSESTIDRVQHQYGGDGLVRPKKKDLGSKLRNTTDAEHRGNASVPDASGSLAAALNASTVKDLKLQLVEQIDSIKQERAGLSSLKRQLETAHAEAQREKQEYRQWKEEERARFEARVQAEIQRVRHSQKSHEEKCRALLHFPSRQARNKIAALEETLNQERNAAQAKETRHKMTEERLSRRIKELESINAELKQDIVALEISRVSEKPPLAQGHLSKQPVQDTEVCSPPHTTQRWQCLVNMQCMTPVSSPVSELAFQQFTYAAQDTEGKVQAVRVQAVVSSPASTCSPVAIAHRFPVCLTPTPCHSPQKPLKNLELRNQSAASYTPSAYIDKVDGGQKPGTSPPQIPGPTTKPATAKPPNHIKESKLSVQQHDIPSDVVMHHFDSGTVCWRWPGGSMMVFTNGDVKQCHASGVVEYYYSSVDAWQVSHPNGTDVYYMADGRLEAVLPGGVREILDSTGAKGVRVLPDGRQLMVTSAAMVSAEAQLPKPVMKRLS